MSGKKVDVEQMKLYLFIPEDLTRTDEDWEDFWEPIWSLFEDFEKKFEKKTGIAISIES